MLVCQFIWGRLSKGRKMHILEMIEIKMRVCVCKKDSNDVLLKADVFISPVGLLIDFLRRFWCEFRDKYHSGGFGPCSFLSEPSHQWRFPSWGKAVVVQNTLKMRQ